MCACAAINFLATGMHYSPPTLPLPPPPRQRVPAPLPVNAAGDASCCSAISPAPSGRRELHLATNPDKPHPLPRTEAVVTNPLPRPSWRARFWVAAKVVAMAAEMASAMVSATAVAMAPAAAWRTSLVIRVARSRPSTSCPMGCDQGLSGYRFLAQMGCGYAAFHRLRIRIILISQDQDQIITSPSRIIMRNIFIFGYYYRIGIQGLIFDG